MIVSATLCFALSLGCFTYTMTLLFLEGNFIINVIFQVR